MRDRLCILFIERSGYGKENMIIKATGKKNVQERTNTRENIRNKYTIVGKGLS